MRSPSSSTSSFTVTHTNFRATFSRFSIFGETFLALDFFLRLVLSTTLELKNLGNISLFPEFTFDANSVDFSNFSCEFEIWIETEPNEIERKKSLERMLKRTKRSGFLEVVSVGRDHSWFKIRTI